LPPGDLVKTLCGMEFPKDTNVIVGMDALDDAGVYRINDQLAIIQTVDFFTPIVDDPYWFGQIAAANALSDIYAMSGIPKTAMNLVAFPLNKMDISLEEDVKDWEASVNKLTEERKQKRNQNNEGLRSDIEGIDRLLETFSACINCHNCMRVCPICYCRQCHFDSDNMKFSFDDYLTRAEARGGLTIPNDTLLFHIGRMLHMSLSCVSCGMCEDACPMAIPVAQVFTLVGDRNQEAFDYIPGRSLDEPLPLKTFEEEEFLEVEQSYTGVSARQENHND